MLRVADDPEVVPTGQLALREFTREERGFTLVEMLVAIVLAAIVLGVTALVVIQSFTGSNDAASHTRAHASAAEIAERFGSDVRGARALGRDGSFVIDLITLEGAIDDNSDIFEQTQEVDWRDIVVAAPNRLVLQVDVVDEAVGTKSVPECVEWVVPSGTTWAVQRIVRQYTAKCAGGGGAVVESDVLTQPTNLRPRPGTGGTPPLFDYTYTVAVAAGGCTTATASSPTAIQRNRIVGLAIDYDSLQVQRDSAARSNARETVALRSRAGADYQTAMGCDQ